MRVEVRYFASIREALGERETIGVEPGMTVGMVRDALMARSPAHAKALARGRSLRSALNQVLCDDDAPIDSAAELAFFPPVTGG